MRMEFFYDGQAVARYGLLTLPVSNETHIKAAFFRGYQYTPEGVWLKTVPEVFAYIRTLEGNKPEPTPAEPVMTAVSAEVTTDESDDTGRQSDTTDRVRSRKRKSRKETTE